MSYTEAITAAVGSLGWRLRKRSIERPATAGSATPAGADTLEAPGLDAVREALDALPNRPVDNRDYDDWIAVCHAVAAATAKSQEGRALWLMWSAQYDDSLDGNNAAADRWASIDLRNVQIGWGWLQEKAAAENPEFRLEVALAEFNAAPDLPEQVNGHAVALDGGLFAEPQHDHPTADDIDNAIAMLEPSDSKGLDNIIKMIALSRVTNSSRERFLLTLKKLTKIGLGVLRDQLNNDIRNLMRDGDDVAIRLAHVALKRFGKGHIAFHRRGWWIYERGMWRQMEDVTIRAELLRAIAEDDRLLLSANGQKAHSASMISAAISNLSGLCDQVLAPLNDPWFTVRNKVNLRNGTLEFLPDGSQRFYNHDPRDCFTRQVEIDYDPLATCPLYDATLRDMVSQTFYTITRKRDPDYEEIKEQVKATGATEGNPLELDDGRLAWRAASNYRVADLAENVRLVNEVMGYALTPWRGARCFAIFKGNGVNGKSALIRAVSSRMPSMVYATTTENLGSRFTLGELDGKLLLTIDEGDQKQAPDAVLKMLCENQSQKADRKGLSHVDVMLTAFTIINTNLHFYTLDTSGGMRSRMLMVPFNKVYDPNDRTHNPWPRIMANDEEMSGALNRWLDGLAAVIARQDIQRSRASLEAFRKWEQANTPEVGFIEAKLTKEQPRDNKAEGDDRATIYQYFLQWHVTNYGNNRFAHGLKKFTEVLEQIGFETYPSKGLTRVRGLWLDPDKVKNDTYIGTEFEPLP